MQCPTTKCADNFARRNIGAHVCPEDFRPIPPRPQPPRPSPTPPPPPLHPSQPPENTSCAMLSKGMCDMSPLCHFNKRTCDLVLDTNAAIQSDIPKIHRVLAWPRSFSSLELHDTSESIGVRSLSESSCRGGNGTRFVRSMILHIMCDIASQSKRIR